MSVAPGSCRARRKAAMRGLGGLMLVLPAAFALAQNPPAQSAPPAADPSALQKFFEETQRLQADFTQLEFDADGMLRRESTGRLYLSRPGRFRLDYMEPDDIMIWADGENLSMFDRELEQVTVWKQAARLRESAAALLAGDASVLEQYRVSAGASEGGLQWFNLVAADGEEGSARLALRGRVPAVIEYSDELGSRVRMLLRDLDSSSLIDDALFNPEIPEGVDVFEAAES